MEKYKPRQEGRILHLPDEGTLLVCTVSLGAATPVMLPIAASAIAMV